MIRIANSLLILTAVLLVSCGGASHGTTTPPPPTQPYLPLAVGNIWNYTCSNNGGNITDSVTQTVTVNGQQTFALQMQFPNGPDQTLLLANDTQGNTTFYGYLVNRTVMAATPAPYVSANPMKNQPFPYAALGGGTVDRIFWGFTVTNPTSLGVLPVAVYNEGGLPAYGYEVGKGVMEQDHNWPQYDCTITSFTVH